jgi:hypothetical protein
LPYFVGLVNRILDEPVQLSKIAFKHTLMEYYHLLKHAFYQSLSSSRPGRPA